MKYNKVLDGVNLSKETKRYVNNYINESIETMRDTGSIQEFIWMPFGFTDNVALDLKYSTELFELIEKNIIVFGSYNLHGILTPHTSNYLGEEDEDGFVTLKYMLSDEVLLKNGFKKVVIREENINV